ncbi:hypothetical protein PDESU_05286 [Pontiella desulfatans]|uniref:Uncharacterized protein n=1 Tax=Pontiella desulfatans TaxID=2750659 RepID=A0A6C2U9N0_PONDE|nr:hypothetical protein [Pontiella desulfatans]VGO16695.1 hypothetical protein PDESU_05286 [Pontiella desulfatans]
MRILELGYEQVKRLQYEGYLKVHPGFSNPVRYTGRSVRDVFNGEI